MNGIVITNQEIGHNRYKIERFNEEFTKLGVNITCFVNNGSLMKIEDGKLVINLPKTDFVLYLDKDIYLARALERAGYRLFNKADFIKLCDDKNLTNLYCSNNGIRMPKTVCGPLFYSKKIGNENLTFLNYLESEFSYPFIMKKVYGSLGTGVFLIHDYDELLKLYTEHCREPLQFQEYIDKSYGKSIRIIIIDKQIVGGFLRNNESDFRSNFGTTASSKKINLPSNYVDFALKIANELKIEYAGIDILIGEDEQPILCEINSNAFFEEFEKVTKINVAKLYAEMVVRKVSYEQKQK